MTEPINKEKLEFITQAARNHLLNFCESINPNYEAQWFHEKIADVLEDAYKALETGQKKRIILSVPPRHGKSQLASIYFPAWVLGKRPKTKFIVSTYGAELAEKNGLETRDLIASNAYSTIFPQTTLKQDMKSRSNWMVDNKASGKENEKGQYYAVGVGGAVTGYGAEVLIIDDPHKDRAEAESPTVRQSVWDYYRSTLYSRLEGQGIIILIMQRWRQDDLVGMILEEEDKKKAVGEPHDNWEIISLPAVAEEDEIYENKVVRKQGEALWDKKFPLSVLESIRQSSPYYWSSQYQQNPILAETAEFKQEMFQYYEDDDLKYKQLRYFTFVDPAISQKKSADNAVVLTVAKEIGNSNIYRIREDAGRFTPRQLVDLIFLHNNNYHSDVWIETTAYQEALKYLVQEEQRTKMRFFVCHEIKSNVSKEIRVRGLLGMYQNKVIWHKKGADSAYELELLAFPKGRRDDRCFVAGTKVATTLGDKNIEDIKIGDYVITPTGSSLVTNAGQTGVSKVITKFGLTGTHNHPVFSKEKGFKRRRNCWSYDMEGLKLQSRRVKRRYRYNNRSKLD
jgi:hypothetical protein